MRCWQKNSKKTNKITVISNRKNSDLKGSGHCFSVKIKFVLVIFSVYAIIINCYGVWRSLVARTAGGREVAGSNPVAPIGECLVYRHFFYLIGNCFAGFFLVCCISCCIVMIFSNSNVPDAVSHRNVINGMIILLFDQISIWEKIIWILKQIIVWM